MTHILHQIDHAIELLDDAYPSVDRSIRETLERAQAEIARLLALITPQPIETAPKDGTRVILFSFGMQTDVRGLRFKSPEWCERIFDPDASKVMTLLWASNGFWSEKWGNWNDGIEPCGLASPTHWLPLPEAPK